MKIGDKVKVKGEGRSGDAIIDLMHDDGRVILNRPIGGIRWWNIKDLVPAKPRVKWFETEKEKLRDDMRWQFKTSYDGETASLTYFKNGEVMYIVKEAGDEGQTRDFGTLIAGQSIKKMKERVVKILKR